MSKFEYINFRVNSPTTYFTIECMRCHKQAKMEVNVEWKFPCNIHFLCTNCPNRETVYYGDDSGLAHVTYGTQRVNQKK